MSIREDFEKAFEATTKDVHENYIHLYKGGALWAANWMAEKCAKYIELQGTPIDKIVIVNPKLIADGLRQLAKELES